MHIISTLFLLFNKDVIMIPIIVIGLLSTRKKIFAHAMVLLTFTLIYNTLLKDIFKVPLYPWLHEGYAFPSGHMHTAVVFYGWLLIHSKNSLKIPLLGIIAGVGWALIFERFHDLFDVAGAFLFGIPTLMAYTAALKTKFFAKRPSLLGAVMVGLSALCIAFLGKTPPIVTLSFASLASFVISWILCETTKRRTLFPLGIVASIIALYLAMQWQAYFYTATCMTIGFWILPLVRYKEYLRR